MTMTMTTMTMMTMTMMSLSPSRQYRSMHSFVEMNDFASSLLSLLSKFFNGFEIKRARLVDHNYDIFATRDFQLHSARMVVLLLKWWTFLADVGFCCFQCSKQLRWMHGLEELYLPLTQRTFSLLIMEATRYFRDSHAKPMSVTGNLCLSTVMLLLGKHFAFQTLGLLV